MLRLVVSGITVVAMVSLSLVGPFVASAAEPGSNGRIAFASSRGEAGWDIWTIRPDGTGMKQLTDDGEFDITPIWSPDGTLIVFHKDGGVGISGIYVMHGDGSNVRKIPGTGENEWAFGWSSDQTSVFSTSWVDTEVTLNRKNLTTGSNSFIASFTTRVRGFTLSPDGTKIAYYLLGNNRNASGDYVGPGDTIYVMNADGTGTSVVYSDSDLAVSHLEWFPDGQRLAFADFTSPYAAAEIGLYEINLNGTGFSRIGDFTNWLAFSPDGLKLAILAPDTPAELAVMNIDGTNRQIITTTESGYNNDTPDWQPCSTSPCPYASSDPTVHQRSVSLSLSQHVIASGVLRVADGFDSCASSQPVKIQKRTSSGWKTIATPFADSQGGYRLKVPDKAGDYRAKAPRKDLSGESDVCGGATSSSVRHRH